MLRNIQEAKFRTVLLPIARRTLSKHAMVDVNFESFFTHIVAHELMHGLGPHQIKVQGRDTTPREELKELYSAIEEAKADVTGLLALHYMIEAEGDYAGAKKVQDELGVVRPVLRSALDNLQGIPTDIEPVFVTADELVPAHQEQPAVARKSRRKRR